MSVTHELKTIKSLRHSIKNAKLVLMQPRFGSSETYVKVTKQDALGLIANADGNETPQDWEMYTDTFGRFDLMTKTLYLG
jgi:hypothetical protein